MARESPPPLQKPDPRLSAEHDPRAGSDIARRNFIEMSVGAAAMFLASPLRAESPKTPAITSGNATLTLNGSQLNVALKGKDGSSFEFCTAQPLALEILDAGGATRRHTPGYSS